MTIWKPIPGHPEYEVSDTGLIRSHRRGAPRILKPCVLRSGHLMVMLGRGCNAAPHRLVLLAFVGPPPEKHEALHLNGVPSDNRLENLRWGTRAENTMMDKWHGKMRARYRLTVEAVRDIRLNARPGVPYREKGNYDMLMTKHGVSRGTISAVVTGRTHKDVGV